MVAAMAGICTQPHCVTGQQGLQRHAHHVPAPLPRRRNCNLRQQRGVSHSRFACSAEPGSAPDAGPSEGAQAAPSTEAAPQMAPRDDDVLPDSLTHAIYQASESVITAMEAGSDRVLAEVLLKDFWDPGSGAIFAEQGDQERFWKLTRKFSDNLAGMVEDGKVRTLYPDMGVAAMLKNEWQDAAFSIGAMSDRTPYQDEDQIVVFAAPDPQAVKNAKIITESARAAGKTVVMFNPKLSSGEVGLGLNVRRLLEDFQGPFTVAYSLRPIGDIGTVFRRYPGKWKVFIEDKNVIGRFNLTAEMDERPGGDELDIIVSKGLKGIPIDGLDEPDEPGFGEQIGRTLGSLRSFMNALTK